MSPAVASAGPPDLGPPSPPKTFTKNEMVLPQMVQPQEMGAGSAGPDCPRGVQRTPGTPS